MHDHTNRKAVTIALMVATLVVAIDGTVVGTAMPTIVSDLGGLKLISWISAAYLLTTAVCTPIWGKLADIFGRKSIFNIGVALFLLGSMFCGLAHNMTELIWARAFQGIGGGAVFPLTLTIISDIYDLEQRAKVQGLFSGIWGVSALLGPLIGGFFVDVLSWRWIFYINVPIGLTSMLLVTRSLVEHYSRRKQTIDYWGAVLFTVWTTALLYALLNGGTTFPWASPVIVGSFVVALTFLTGFIWVEKRAEEPMLPLFLFRIRNILVPLIAGFMMFSIVIALGTYLPLLIQGVEGRDATSAGLALTPNSLGWSSGAAIAGPLIVRLGARNTAVIGGACLILGSCSLPFVATSTSEWILFVVMLFMGWGFGFLSTVFLFVVQSSVEWNLRGVATASQQFVNAMSQTISIALLGTWFNHVIFTRTEGKFSSKEMNRLLDPKYALHLPTLMLKEMRGVLFAGLHSVFVILAFAGLLSVAVALWVPKRLNRTVRDVQEVHPVAEGL